MKAGYSGAPWEELLRRLVPGAWVDLTDSLRSGQIHRRWAARGQPTKPDAALQRHPFPEDIAAEAVAHVQADLRDKILIPGLWDPTRGQSLEGYFTAWCVGSALNVYRRYQRNLRAEKLTEPSDLDGAVIYLPATRNQDPAEIVCQRDLARRALLALSGPERAAVELLAMGRGYQEISEQLGISIESVRARISRGRNRAARRFGRDER